MGHLHLATENGSRIVASVLYYSHHVMACNEEVRKWGIKTILASCKLTREVMPMTRRVSLWVLWLLGLSICTSATTRAAGEGPS